MIISGGKIKNYNDRIQIILSPSFLPNQGFNCLTNKSVILVNK